MSTLSIIKADTGGFVGHSEVHPDLLTTAQDAVDGAIADGLLTDGKVARCGDDISLIMTHEHGADAEKAHAFAWDTSLRTTAVAGKYVGKGRPRDDRALPLGTHRRTRASSARDSMTTQDDP